MPGLEFIFVVIRGWAPQPSFRPLSSSFTSLGECWTVSPTQHKIKCTSANIQRMRLCNCCNTEGTRQSNTSNSAATKQLPQVISIDHDLSNHNKVSRSDSTQTSERRSEVLNVTSNIVTDPCYLSAYVVGLLKVQHTAIHLSLILFVLAGDSGPRMDGRRSGGWQLLCSKEAFCRHLRPCGRCSKCGEPTFPVVPSCPPFSVFPVFVHKCK